MPKFTHTVSTKYVPTFRSEAVVGMFDVDPQLKLTKSWDVDMPIEDIPEWEIGMIVGPSGSGKTTIAKRAFPDAKLFDGIKHEGWGAGCVVDDFASNLKVGEITGSLSQVGFSSPPAWILPFHSLSNGQKFRAEIARLILETENDDMIVVDEFTSVVDRDVAKVCCAAVQKMIRRSPGKKMIAVSCHNDIAEWLEPDWIYFVDTGEFRVTRGLLRRPPIEIVIRRVHHSTWRLFAGHHYLNASCSKSARCYLATIDGKPVGFAAAIPFPHPKLKNMWRGHRTVVLPDYQGIGIGNVLSEFVGQMFLNEGKRYSSLTSHPAMVAHRSRSPKWIMTRAPGRVPVSGKTGMLKTSSGRMTASFEYIGEKNA